MALPERFSRRSLLLTLPLALAGKEQYDEAAEQEREVRAGTVVELDSKFRQVGRVFSTVYHGEQRSTYIDNLLSKSLICQRANVFDGCAGDTTPIHAKQIRIHGFLARQRVPEQDVRSYLAKVQKERHEPLNIYNPQHLKPGLALELCSLFDFAFEMEGQLYVPWAKGRPAGERGRNLEDATLQTWHYAPGEMPEGSLDQIYFSSARSGGLRRTGLPRTLGNGGQIVLHNEQRLDYRQLDGLYRQILERCAMLPGSPAVRQS